MPYVNVRMLKGRTVDQKKAIIAGVTKVVSDVLGKDPKATYVVIDEVDSDNWGIGGESMTERKKKSQSNPT